jgi:DNA (cytosine-5)-methyltransferase 1
LFPNIFGVFCPDKKSLDNHSYLDILFIMRSIELFSGAGGLALGLEKAGFESVAHVERNRDACATLRLNRPNWNVLEADIQSIDFTAFSNIDLVAGGPPCQPFSMGGCARGYNDSRDMFPQSVRAVRELQPKAFIFENVRGLLRAAFRNYVEFIRLQLTYPAFPISQNVDWEDNLRRLERHHTSTRKAQDLSYNVSIHLADAADFGVPQRRHRVFFVGFRSDLNARWFFPSHTHSCDELIRAQYVTGSYWQNHRIETPSAIPDPVKRRLYRLENDVALFPALPWRTVRDAIRDLGEPGDTSPWTDHFLQPGARSYPGHTGSPLDEPSKALKAGDHGVPGGENMLRYPTGEVRYFSVRESARIQTFPDDWRFYGSWTESMRQLGNAVPVDLGFQVAQSVREHMMPDGQRKRLQSTR